MYSPFRKEYRVIKAAGMIVLFFICSLRTASSNAAGADPLPANEATPAIEWCGTQIRFEQKMRALGYSAEATASACPKYGPCDNPSMRDYWIAQPGSPLTRIRLAVHVLANSDGSYPFTTPEGVQAAVDQVNQLFLSSRLQFEHVFDQVNSDEWRVLSEDEIDPMRAATAFDPTTWLNIWVTNVTYGYSLATFPFDPDALSPIGGVVLAHLHWGGNYSGLAHEIGHCLGLWHNFHGIDEVTRCGPCYEAVDSPEPDRTGDFCSDTPPTPIWYSCGNAAGVEVCSGLSWGYTQPENCMGYTPIDCRYLFTEQQQGRMHCWVDDVLSGWVAYSQDSCCQGHVGDANDDGADEPTLGDVMQIIDMLFISCRPVACLAEADINQSGGPVPVEDDITLGDVMLLVDYLFITGSLDDLAECL